MKYPGPVPRDREGHCHACGCKPRRKKTYVERLGWNTAKNGTQFRLIHRAKSYRIQMLRQIPGYSRYAWFDIQKIGCTRAYAADGRQRVPQEEEVAWNTLRRRVYQYNLETVEPCSGSPSSSTCEPSAGAVERWLAEVWTRLRGFLRVIGVGSGTTPSPRE